MPVPAPGRPAAAIKVTLVGDDVPRGLRAFQLSIGASRSREVFFCESSPPCALALLNAGIILRLRHDPHGAGDSTVTVQLRRPDQLRGRWSRDWCSGTHTFLIEEELAGSRELLVASLIRAIPGDQVRQARHDRVLGTVFSRRQGQLLAACSPVPVNFDRLTILGPVQARRWSLADAGFAVTAERWTVDALDLLELSLRVEPQDAPFVRLAFLAFVRRRGLDPDATQLATTQLVLNHLSWG